MSIQADRVIAERTAKTIYQAGDCAVKLFDKDYPASAVLSEAQRQALAFECGLKAPRVIKVEADEGRILQVIYNLINNAVNYTGEDKTVVIRQTVEDTDNRPDTVLLEVIDTGIGISEEDLPLVWERYYKVNDFHKQANMGTGLGLSIVKN